MGLCSLAPLAAFLPFQAHERGREADVWLSQCCSVVEGFAAVTLLLHRVCHLCVGVCLCVCRGSMACVKGIKLVTSWWHHAIVLPTQVLLPALPFPALHVQEYSLVCVSGLPRGGTTCRQHVDELELTEQNERVAQLAGGVLAGVHIAGVHHYGTASERLSMALQS